MHTEGDTLDEAVVNAEEALRLYVEAVRVEGRSLDMGVVRRSLALPARADTFRLSPVMS